MTPNGVVAALLIVLMVGTVATLCAVLISNQRERTRTHQAADPEAEATAQRQRSADLAQALGKFDAARVNANQHLVEDLNEAIERDQALGGRS